VRVSDLGWDTGVVEVSGDEAETGISDDLAEFRRRVCVDDGEELDLGVPDLPDGLKDAREILWSLLTDHVELDTVLEGGFGGEGGWYPAEGAAAGGSKGREAEEVAAGGHGRWSCLTLLVGISRWRARGQY
jgi:hypothetical protein